MSPARLGKLTGRYPHLHLAVLGDFCLDRYLEIDPARAEVSLETGLPVHNITRVRSQPGAAGTIVNNLVALGVGRISLIGFCGEDGEGWELQRALAALPGVQLEHFRQTSQRATFTYTKPLIVDSTREPYELSRLDIKNWTPTADDLGEQFANSARRLAGAVDGMIVMDQVNLAGTGVVTSTVLQALGEIASTHRALPVLADSRRTLRDFPGVLLKMNALELAAFTETPLDASLEGIAAQTRALVEERGRTVFVTLAERGMLAVDPQGALFSCAAHPVHGPIDVVGAGDAVTANLVAALAAGATVEEALTLANAAASIVVHQVGTTGTATPAQIAQVLFNTG